MVSTRLLDIRWHSFDDNNNNAVYDDNAVYDNAASNFNAANNNNNNSTSDSDADADATTLAQMRRDAINKSADLMMQQLTGFVTIS